MRKPNVSILYLIALLAIVPLAWAREVVPVGYLRIASQNVLNREVMPLLSKLPMEPVNLEELIAHLEKEFSFIGEGGISSSHAGGLFYGYAQGVNPEQLGFFAIPVNAGYATLQVFDDAGAQRVPRFPDARFLNKVYFVRTANHILWGANPAVLSLPRSPLWQTFLADTSLASACFDGSAIDEDGVKTILRKLKEQDAEKRPERNSAEAWGEEWGQQMALDAMEDLLRCRMRLLVSKTADALKLEIEIDGLEPLQMSFAIPGGLPGHLPVVCYLGYMQWLPKALSPFLNELKKQLMREKKLTTPKEKRLFGQFQENLESFWRDCQTFSGGVDIEEGVFYLVKDNQAASNRDSQFLQGLVDGGNEMEKLGGGRQVIQGEKMTLDEVPRPGERTTILRFWTEEGQMGLVSRERYTYFVILQGADPARLAKAVQNALTAPRANVTPGTLFLLSIKLRSMLEQIDRVSGNVDPELRKFLPHIPRAAEVRLSATQKDRLLRAALTVPISVFEGAIAAESESPGESAELKESPVALCERAKNAIKAKRYDEAMVALGQAMAQDPSYVPSYLERGKLYLEQKNYSRAKADFDQAVQLNPDYAAGYCNRGIVNAETKQYTEAMADFNKAIALWPSYAIAYYQRGLLYLQRDQCEMAIRDFDRAIENFPNYAQAFYRRGKAQYALKRYEEARLDYEKARKLKSDIGPYYGS